MAEKKTWMAGSRPAKRFLKLALRAIVQRGVLTTHRIGDRRIEAPHPFPFRLRPGPAIAADLVDAPIDFQAVAVGIAEFDGQLATGAPAALENDFDLAFAPGVAGAHHLLHGP